MSQRHALMLAAALTAFVLVLIGGVAAGITQPWAANAAAPAASNTPDPTVQALLARDAQYRQLIEQANQRLQQAYAQPQQPAEQQPAAQQPAAPQPSYPVSAEQAAGIAQQAAPGARLTRGAELVSFQGTVAYEVLFDLGAVYVDATSGAVVYNGATVTASAPPFFGGEHEDHDNHESHDNHEGGEDH
jgi:uncharacterized membrane protein YkoI